MLYKLSQVRRSWKLKQYNSGKEIDTEWKYSTWNGIRMMYAFVYIHFAGLLLTVKVHEDIYTC